MYREFLHFDAGSPLGFPTLAVPSLAEYSRIAFVLARLKAAVAWCSYRRFSDLLTAILGHNELRENFLIIGFGALQNDFNDILCFDVDAAL